MLYRILTPMGMPLIAIGLIVSLPASGQTPAKKWRTPWGDPDLQGSWSNSTTTPLERPAKYAGREFMTATELAERRAAEKAANAKRDDPGQAPSGFAWFEG